MVVPDVRGRHVFLVDIRDLESIGRFEFGDGLGDPAAAPQFVPEHVTRVRHLRRHPPVRLGLRERVAGAARILERVRHVVMRRELFRGERGRSLEKAHGTWRAALAALSRVGRLGQPAQQPQLHVIRPLHERIVDRLAVRCEPDDVTRCVLGGHLGVAQFDVTAIVLAGACGESTRAIERRSSVDRCVQLHIRVAEADVGDRQGWIKAQRLVERARGFDPHIRMQVGQALIVVRLRLRIAGRDDIVRDTDAHSKRQRPLDDVARERRHRMSGVVSLCGKRRSGGDEQAGKARRDREAGWAERAGWARQ